MQGGHHGDMEGLRPAPALIAPHVPSLDRILSKTGTTVIIGSALCVSSNF